ncbi:MULTISPECIES: hypothetical protein [unclassified Pseudoalteromonas]|uniref:hypothetical protein n=1 Tax=unclassified Pseudoalteromonas TaxID=194690 RepID=UPI0005A6C06B|nr:MULTISPECIES: hypothetical protein [unclassified Pseudoalteromonas]
MKKLLIASGIIASILATSAFADSQKRIVENLTLSTDQSLDIKFPVGSVDIEIVDGDQLEIEIELKPQDSKWNSWFSSDKDLGSIKLDKNISNSHVTLEIDEDDLNQEWHIKVPRSAEIDIDLGVGSVEIDNLSNSVEVDVGVGSVVIDTDTNDFKRIDLESGVGDTRISGFSGDSSQKRQMVSSSSAYTGSGLYRIEVEVGVGDVKVSN